jgi:hypothetical protein
VPNLDHHLRGLLNQRLTQRKKHFVPAKQHFKRLVRKRGETA